MSVMDRRRFLQTGALARQASPPRRRPPKKEDDKGPKFRLGLVTYNIAARPGICLLCSRLARRLACRPSSCAPPTSTASSRR